MGDRVEVPDPVDRRDRSKEPARRSDAIDFWRGFILCTIFVNHVPGNVFERLTFRNFGFSDSSEAFVFISGLSLALAYGRRFMAGADGVVLAHLGRRAIKIYAIHILLSLAGVAIFALGALITAHADLMQVHGRDLVVDDPIAAMIGLFSLGHQFGYFNILPLYVLLVGMAPVLFWLARISSPLMLSVSASVYVVSRLFGLNVPSWPMRGTWFFDPFAWQLLMAVGLAVGLSLRGGIPAPRRWLTLLAGLVVAGSAICATDGFSLWPGLGDAVRAHVDVDKTSLGLGRLLHFLSLAYLLYAAGVIRVLRHVAGYAPLCLIGRHGLLVFALLSLMAAGAQVIVATLGNTVLVDSVVIFAGLFALYGAARLVERGGALPLVAEGRL
jgi:hypothetical protein